MTQEQYLVEIETEPTAEMIKEAKDAGGVLLYRYIPKVVLERELRRVYGGRHSWDMERDTITSKGAWGKGVLTLIHPVDGTIVKYSGTASVAMDRKMQLVYPGLEARCIINACRKIGPWFGQNLNVAEDNVEDTGNAATEEDQEASANLEFEQITAKINACTSRSEAAEILAASPFKYNIELKKIIQKLPA